MNIRKKGKQKLKWVWPICLILSINAGSVLAYSSAPPNSRTNAPGEGNCTSCHSSFPLNSGSGVLSVSGIPDFYEAGQTYELAISPGGP